MDGLFAMKGEALVPNAVASQSMLTQDESILGEINVVDVEKEYWNGKAKKRKYEYGMNSSIKRCDSPELFEDDDFIDHVSCELGDIVQIPGMLAVANVENFSINSSEASKDEMVKELSKSEDISKEGTLQDDYCNKNSFDCGMPLKDKIKKALLENAHKTPIANKSTESNFQQTLVVEDIPNYAFQSNFFELGPFYGLPSKVSTLIKKNKGIDKLYSWQEECLSLPALEERKNLVYSLPTSGGKTLVAEILMLREILCRKKNALFVLPYVAIVQEKATIFFIRSLAPFGIDLDFLVEEYAAGKGRFPPRKRRRKQVLFIATIEKAHGIVNSLVEEGRLSELGLVVVDELHLIGEKGGRGAILEAFLTKLIYSKEDIQIVGMSATIGNLPEIARYLKAETFCKDFRPVELKEYVKVENDLWTVNRNSLCPEDDFKLSRKINFQYSSQMLLSDPDQLGGLVAEVVPANSCLVFCPTKKNCENVASLICQILPSMLLDHKKSEKKALYKALSNEGNGSVCSVLKRTLPFGVAYHHSGLTADERRLIEEAYTMGTLSCICCTSTLAAGVNLPAKRVILRSPYISNQFINLSRYKQMIGRAGRAGFDTYGESILICQSNEVDRVRELLKSCMDEAITTLHEGGGQAIENLVLSSVGLKLADTRKSLHKLFGYTLLEVQAERLEVETSTLVDKALSRLLKIKMLVPSKPTSALSTKNNSECDVSKSAKTTLVIDNETMIMVSKLGRAAIKGSIELNLAEQLYKDLRQAQSGLVLLNFLHLLHLVTPYDIASSIKYLPNIYYKAYTKLSPLELQTAHVLGISESCMMGIVSGKAVKGVTSHVLNRFYVTLMLNDLWNQMSVWEVSIKYDIPRGVIQSLMTKAASFASNVLHFCQEFEELWAFQDLLGNFSQRLSHCCHVELLPLMDLPAVKRGRARQLYNAGFKNLHDIANSTPQQLVSTIDHMSRRVAQQIIAAAKLLLLEKVENLREEAEDLMDGLVNSHSV
ncbi:hypothetical protein J437_LFUL006442 [Ladona fulva]|uniref:Helicase POLQ-like n=1 Tax=Ladona fulva TaxID=123851 RepID=A0A8K0JYG6_LADFU|nr:hypothetical protein J437_LFUL006442 [Ladona fulva]